MRGAQLAPLVDVPVSSSAFVVERGVADMKLDAYAVGWDQSTGPQWRVIGSGDLRDGALRTLPLSKPVTDIAGGLSASVNDSEWVITSYLAANATILPGLTIGERAMVGAGAVVTRDVPPLAIVTGNPARIVGYDGAPPAETAVIAEPGVAVGASATRVEGVTLHRLPQVDDLRGNLSFGEVGKQVPFEVKTEGNEKHITGTIPTTLADFKIEPPSLLTMPVKNEIPVHVDMTWSPQ